MQNALKEKRRIRIWKLKNLNKRVIIAGGGTGGHIFPALAIANALKKKEPDMEILFVGARGKMEMEKVPEAGYPIEGIDITGYNRSSILKNFTLPYKLVKSYFQVKNIFKTFRPQAAIGVADTAASQYYDTHRQKEFLRLFMNRILMPANQIYCWGEKLPAFLQQAMVWKSFSLLIVSFKPEIPYEKT